MFICVFITYKFRVHDMFDGMTIIARPCYVKFLSEICMEGFFLFAFMVLERFIKFLDEVWILA